MTIIQHADASRVSRITEPARIARLMRSNMKMYRHAPVRGELVTVAQAARRTGMAGWEIRQLVEDGQLPAHDTLVVDMADLAEEEDAAFTARASGLIERATGEAPAPGLFERLFGTAEQRIDRTRGEAVAS